MFFYKVYDHTAPETLQDDSLKRYCGAFDQNISIENYREIIEDVELTYIVPHVGPAFYTELESTYDDHLNGGSPDADRLAFIRKLQPAIAYFTLFEAIASRSIFVSDMGPGQSISKDGTYIFPSKWRSQSGLRKAFQTANRRLSRALEYLNDNANAAGMATYKSSTYFDENRRYFFNSPAELQNYLPMEASQVVFNLIKPVINEAEQRYIYRLIGGDFFDELKAAIKADSLSADQSELIEKIRWALSRWIRIYAIPNLRLRISDTNLVELTLTQTLMRIK